MHARRSLLIALLALSLSACASLLPPRETGELVFWRVARADGAGGSVHLLGSLHLGREDFPFDPAITAALAGDDQLVLEVAPDELSSAALQALIRERGRLPAGRSLADELSPDTLAALEKRLAELGWPEEPWLRVKPWVVSLALAGDALSDSGFAPEHGVERSLSQSPALGGKPVRGIETAREQIERLDALPPATQELLLRDLLRERHGALFRRTAPGGLAARRPAHHRARHLQAAARRRSSCVLRGDLLVAKPQHGRAHRRLGGWRRRLVRRGRRGPRRREPGRPRAAPREGLPRRAHPEDPTREGVSVQDIHPSVWIAPGAQIYGRVAIGEGSSVWPNVVIRCECEHVRIGRNTNIQDFTMIHVGYRDPTVIGDLCLDHAPRA